jgi:hypothetical protein
MKDNGNAVSVHLFLAFVCVFIYIYMYKSFPKLFDAFRYNLVLLFHTKIWTNLGLLCIFILNGVQT